MPASDEGGGGSCGSLYDNDEAGAHSALLLPPPQFPVPSSQFPVPTVPVLTSAFE